MDEMNLLIMGGTRFIGPHIIRSAQARGHTVTMFNRGKTNPELFPDVDRLTGDNIDHYLLISTISVYDGWDWECIDEDTPKHDPLYDRDVDLTGETYGPIKVTCEERAHEGAPDALTILRPGIVAGPGDHTDARDGHGHARVGRRAAGVAPVRPIRGPQPHT